MTCSFWSSTFFLLFSLLFFELYKVCIMCAIDSHIGKRALIFRTRHYYLEYIFYTFSMFHTVAMLNIKQQHPEHRAQ
jgi:hypothetical protein